MTTTDTQRPSTAFNTISVVGLGYIGLPTAAMFASRKVKVIGVDVNQATVDTINRGEIHIVEPDLDIAVRAAVSQGYLSATTTPAPADAFLIAVPTPFKGDDHEPDLSYIRAASHAIAPVLKVGDIVVLESTSPVGATELMAGWLAEARPDLTFPQTHGENSDVRVAHCPERVLPGKVMQELISNDRVIGGLSPLCSQQAVELYKIFVTGECVVTTARTAEMAKLTENSFRDVNIAFANELSIICDRMDIDVWELVALANRHPRVNILQPGPGVGGHCIAVDPWFIVSSAPDEARLIRSARTVNDAKPGWVAEKVLGRARRMGGTPMVACLGLAYKPDVDDLRESPSVDLALMLTRSGEVRVQACEPFISALPKGLAEAGVELVDLETALEADIVLCLTPHAAFRAAAGRIASMENVADYCGLLQLSPH